MTEIDNDLYSRQLYVLGTNAMSKLAKSRVLLYGVGALGVEIAKNLILAGIGSLSIIDQNICNVRDLGNQFFINQHHIDSQFTRANASIGQLSELNCYVKIEDLKVDLKSLNDAELNNILSKYDCVILTEAKSLVFSIKINECCRKLSVKFLMSDVYGLFGWSFTDFGDHFDCIDVDGEEYAENFIGSMVKLNEDGEILIETQNEKLHRLDNGDLVKFTEIMGSNDFNERIFPVKVINAKKFSINAKSNINMNQLRGGLFKQVKATSVFSFKSLKEQLNTPNLTLTDLSENKYYNSYYIHICLMALHLYYENNLQDYDGFCNIVKQSLAEFNLSNPNILNSNISILDNQFNSLISKLYYTSESKFPPLCALYGGVVAQEVIKSVTNKFSPFQQWLHIECTDLYENECAVKLPVLNNDRYDALRICFGGEKTLLKLKNSTIFMVGCGAIGCEMLKNYALLAIGCDSNGSLTITDNDLIEKSNLSRQFLFRSQDIQNSKSVTAAKAIKKINSDINLIALEKKVCSQTENEIFTDAFFAKLDICINALDNVEARRYMDNRCVANKKPLLETGTLGAKGHVQVIVPYITESYNSQKDPNDSESEIPYCTLKSFPSNIEHCIQWARDKFESNFKIKPEIYEKFFNTNKDVQKVINSLKEDENIVIDGSNKVAKILENFCSNWCDCLLIGRIKFEKYFSNKAKDLLHAYPLDHLMKDGSLFWNLPKRPPNPIKFDSNNKLHLDFVQSFARLLSEIFKIPREQQIEDEDKLRNFLNSIENKVPTWVSANKHIETDENKKKDQILQESTKNIDNIKQAKIYENFLEKYKSIFSLNPLNFEKDNDLNGHIDFISVAANLRASMYSIEHSDKLHIKKIAGKIVPAIATTTSCIAGYASIELVKLIQSDWKLEKFRNLFLNLAIPLFLLSEPGVCIKTKITQDCSVSLWDTWSIKGSQSFTLKNLIDAIKKSYNLTVSGVIQGSKTIYMPIMPGHSKRLNETMIKLLKKDISQGENFVDLFMTYAECDNDESRDRNNLCPPIRYYF